MHDLTLLESTRRHFFQNCKIGLGSLALTSMLNSKASADRGILKDRHHAPKAKSVIFLFMAGGPSQLDMFTPKPKLNELSGKPIPQSFIEGKRFAFLKGVPNVLGTPHKFQKAGQCGMDVSDLMPYHRKIADDVCWIRSMKTDVFNHGPAKCFVNTGSPQFGRPSMGSWVTYGIGSESENLPGFVVLQSGPRGPRGGAALWSSGFLPSTHQGVPFLKGAAPILDLKSPPGVDEKTQRQFVDAVKEMNSLRHDVVGDPEIQTRIAAYETAYRMQSAAPELMDLSKETKETLDLYGAEIGKPSYASNCLLARRLIQRGVRFVQLYHTNWDHHGGNNENLEKHLPEVCKDVDKASSALVKDLKRLGLLDDTIVIWGGEFGRTPMGEKRESVGRDHHIDAYTMWITGGGFKRGIIHGDTDDIGYDVTSNAVHVHDFQATILHQLGIDHTKLTYRFQGRDFRLTDVHGHVVKEILA